MSKVVCIAPGDGIGPELMEAVVSVLRAAQVPLRFEPVEMGAAVYTRGFSSGMTDEARARVEASGVLLKGPMATPKLGGVKSINVTARKMWSAYANKRIFKTLPGVETLFSKAHIPIDITMIRENIEDTYGGIEHMLTHDVALCRRLITRPGSQQLHRYAFELAKRNGGGRITCGHKANIMKLTDGLFLESFYNIAKEYPGLIADDMIVDDMAMKLVSRPDQFDFIVLPNLQGDILSDLCAGLVGGLGFAPAANIGEHVAIFEAVHGTAPDIAGKGVANPAALLMSAAMMLRHLELREHAAALDAALMQTLASGVHTADFGSRGSEAVTTKTFIAELLKNLAPVAFAPECEAAAREVPNTPKMQVSPKWTGEKVVGVDLFVESEQSPQLLAERCASVLHESLRVDMISNRGTQVWPGGSVFTECVNQFRVRILKRNGAVADVSELLRCAEAVHQVARLCSVEMLLQFGTRMGYSLAQGQ
jgi:isocitrate dehydrogenase